MATVTAEHVTKINVISSSVTQLQALLTTGSTVNDYQTWLKLEDIERNVRFLKTQLNPTARS